MYSLSNNSPNKDHDLLADLVGNFGDVQDVFGQFGGGLCAHMVARSLGLCFGDFRDMLFGHVSREKDMLIIEQNMYHTY